jgi:hypothetical protein
MSRPAGSNKWRYDSATAKALIKIDMAIALLSSISMGLYNVIIGTLHAKDWSDINIGSLGTDLHFPLLAIVVDLKDTH